jgi:hypothetical protein
MSISFEELLQEAEKLPEPQRAELAAAMLRSLDPPADDDPAEIERLWILEAKRRSEEIARGEAVTIPGDQVFAELRERYG